MKNFSYISIFKITFLFAFAFVCINFNSFTSYASSGNTSFTSIIDLFNDSDLSNPFASKYKYSGYSTEWTSLDMYNKRVASSLLDYKNYISNLKKQKLNSSVYFDGAYSTDYYFFVNSDSLKTVYADKSKSTVLDKVYNNFYSFYCYNFRDLNPDSKLFIIYEGPTSKTEHYPLGVEYFFYFYDASSQSITRCSRSIIDSPSFIASSNYTLNTGSSSVSNSSYVTSKDKPYFTPSFNHNRTMNYSTYDIESHLYSVDTNCLVFLDEESALKYFRDGDESGIYRTPFQGSEDNVPDDNPDVELGYLKGLHLKEKLNVYNEENGGIFDLQTFFEWADTYDFDDSYYVEVSARVHGQYKLTPLNFGFSSKIENYIGKMRQIKIVPYNDLGVDFYHKSDVLPFIQKDLDELKELTPFGSVNAFDIDYFFRICHKTSSGYKYGPYTAHINTSDNLFKGETTNYEIQYGTVDSEGDLILDSDLPPEKPTPPIIGTGSSFEEAEKDANDPNNPTNPDNQGKPGFDLSLENISQVFTWFIDSMKNIIVSLGSFPQFIASVFPFLPSSFSTFLMIGLAVVIILRLLGR